MPKIIFSLTDNLAENIPSTMSMDIYSHKPELYKTTPILESRAFATISYKDFLELINELRYCCLEDEQREKLIEVFNNAIDKRNMVED